MVVNGLTLPASFERFIRSPNFRMFGWLTKEGGDAYGNYWDPDLLEFYTDPATMAERTGSMPHALRVASQTPEQIAERNVLAADKPGAIPFITDFSPVLLFGQNSSGEVLGFDYRDNPEEPSVIFLDGWYWRRVAPDFDTFVDLLELWDGIQSLEDRDEELFQKFHPDYDPNCAYYDPKGALAGAQPTPTAVSRPGGADSSTDNGQPAVVTGVPVYRRSEGPGTMTVNGLALPASFEAFIERYPSQVWDLKGSFDAYGLPLVNRYGLPALFRFVPYDARDNEGGSGGGAPRLSPSDHRLLADR